MNLAAAKRIGTIVVVVVAAIELIGIIWIWVGSDSDEPRAKRAPRPPATVDAEDPAEEATVPGRVCETPGEAQSLLLARTHHNEPGSYFVDYPRGWTVTGRGSVSKLTSAGGDASVSIGAAPPGKVAKAMDDFVAALRGSLRAIEIDRRGSRSGDRCGSAWVAGSALNRDGVRLHFRGDIVRSGDRNFALGAFVAASQSSYYLPIVRGIASSLRANQA